MGAASEVTSLRPAGRAPRTGGVAALDRIRTPGVCFRRDSRSSGRGHFARLCPAALAPQVDWHGA